MVGKAGVNELRLHHRTTIRTSQMSLGFNDMGPKKGTQVSKALPCGRDTDLLKEEMA